MTKHTEVVLGVHSCVPKVIANWEEWKEFFVHCTPLALNEGYLPPFQICAGDRNRVRHIASLLTEGVVVNDILAQHGLPTGRVTVAVGYFEGCPVAVWEHLMGTPATEILTRELSDPLCTRLTYNMPEGKTVTADAVHLVRVGSCGGINLNDEEYAAGAGGPRVSVGDAVVMNAVVGVTGADIQALTGRMNLLSVETIESTKEELRKLGYSEQGGEWTAKSDERLAEALTEAAAARGVSSHTMGYISKDSLYAEAEEEEFVRLRRSFNVGCSEMEVACMVRFERTRKIEGAFPLRCGAVCAVIGLIPGGSFSDDPVAVRKAIDGAIYTGLGGLSVVFKQFK